ncbi:hypothetical protein [Aurantivibrio infirmus]
MNMINALKSTSYFLGFIFLFIAIHNSGILTRNHLNYVSYVEKQNKLIALYEEVLDGKDFDGLKSEEILRIKENIEFSMESEFSAIKPDDSRYFWLMLLGIFGSMLSLSAPQYIEKYINGKALNKNSQQDAA